MPPGILPSAFIFFELKEKHLNYLVYLDLKNNPYQPCPIEIQQVRLCNPALSLQLHRIGCCAKYPPAAFLLWCIFAKTSFVAAPLVSQLIESIHQTTTAALIQIHFPVPSQNHIAVFCDIILLFQHLYRDHPVVLKIFFLHSQGKSEL